MQAASALGQAPRLDEGFDGMTMSFVDYVAELEYFAKGEQAAQLP
jgi:hypothetical protein